MKTKILLIVTMMSSVAIAQRHLEIQTLIVPTKLCALEGEFCMMIDAGVVGVLKSPLLADQMAYGTLAQDTEFSWVKIPKGALINFWKLQNPSFNLDDNWDFEITLNREISYSGILFKEKTAIGFDRYQKIFDSNLKKYIYKPHDVGFVRIYGNPAHPTRVEGLNFQENSILAVSTMVGFLENTMPTRAQVIYGVVSTDGLYPAVSAIPVVKGDLIDIDHARRELRIRVPNMNGRFLMPQNILVEGVEYNLNTGLISEVDVAWGNTAMINGLLLYGAVRFDDSGLIKYAEDLAGNTYSTLVPQSAQGIYFDRQISYHGFVEFWPSGKLMTVPTLHVQKNSHLLPAEVVASLPEILQDSSDRIRFFFDQLGSVRVVVVENWDSPVQRFQIFTAKSDQSGVLEFTSVQVDSDFGQMIAKSQRNGVTPEMVAYLKGL